VQILSDLKLYFCNRKLTQGIVHCHRSICHFVRVEDIFVECDDHTSIALVAAAASGQVHRLLISCARLKGDWRLMNDQHLLVLEDLFVVSTQGGLDAILYDGLRFVMMMLVVVHDR
jgi:hypothetical protein